MSGKLPKHIRDWLNSDSNQGSTILRPQQRWVGCQPLAGNRLPNLRRRVDRARSNSWMCPASRHLHMIAEALATGKIYHMLTEEPEHCAGTMLSVLESLWKARRKIKRLTANVKPSGA